MTKAELMDLVGKRVRVKYHDDRIDEGILAYADTFSAEHGYIKPNYFYFKDSTSNMTFKVSHIKKAKLI